MKSISGRRWLFVGAMLGGLAVACGAFGAHGLKGRFEADGVLSEQDEQQLAHFETAARYQMYHALGLLAVGLLRGRGSGRLLDVAGAALVVGTLVFSGCLYGLVLTGQRWLGAVVPIGGTLLIVGWLCLSIAVWRWDDRDVS